MATKIRANQTDVEEILNDPSAGASEIKKGSVEIASQAEVNAGSDTLLVVTPNTLSNSTFFEPADATILKDADIGVNVQAYSANILFSGDIGVTVASQSHDHSGVYEPADATILRNVVEDTSPQLGGDLDINNFNIVGAAGGTTASASIDIIGGATGLGVHGGNVNLTGGAAVAGYLGGNIILTPGVGATSSAYHGNIQLDGDVVVLHAGSPSLPVVLDIDNTLARVAINGLASDSAAALQVAGDIHVDAGVNYRKSDNTVPLATYRGGTNFFTVRDYADLYTIQMIWSPPGEINSGSPATHIEREATLALVRGDEPNQEFVDFYNNGYLDETQFGMRMQKRGTGVYRPFVFDYYDGVTKSTVLTIDTTGVAITGDLSVTGIVTGVALDDLSDVALAPSGSPAVISDGEVLSYVAGSPAGYWVNVPISTVGALSAVEDDTDPHLGGNLDTNGYEIITASSAVQNVDTDNIIIRAGSHYHRTAGAADFGNVDIIAGNNSGYHKGGTISITAGDGTGGSTGFNTDAEGGDILLTAGDSSPSIGGAVKILSGQGGVISGEVRIETAAKSGYTGLDTGAITIRTGDAQSGLPGTIFITGGDSYQKAGDGGGSIEIVGGNNRHQSVLPSPTNPAYAGETGGSVTIKGGYPNLSSPQSIGGSVNIEPGQGGLVNGEIQIHSAGQLTQGSIQFYDDISGKYVALMAPLFSGSPATNNVFVLPEFDGTNGQVLQTDGSGGLSFIDVDTTDLVKWNDVWVDGTYLLNDMVRDGTWTMIANKTTTDRPAPQEVGEPLHSIDQTSSFDTASNTSIVKMVHNFTIDKTGWLKQLRVHVPIWDTDVVSRVTVVDVTNDTATIINNPILQSGEYTTIGVENVLVTVGTEMEVWFELYNSSDANSINGGWVSNIGTGIPANQEFNIDNTTIPTVIEIDHDDLDSVSRAGELDGVSVGSIINIHETGDASRNVDVEVDTVDTTSGTSTKYTVSLLNLGQKSIRDNRVCSIKIDIPITQPTQYSVVPDLYAGSPHDPTWATITTELYYGGVLQADVNDAYGIDVIFQEAHISADWDLVAASGSSASTGSNVSSLDNLTDVAFGSPAPSVGDVLTYIAGSPSYWTNQAPFAGNNWLTAHNGSNFGVAPTAGTYSIAMGEGTTATGTRQVAIGHSISMGSAAAGIAIGDNVNIAAGAGNIAIGDLAQTIGNFGNQIVLGNATKANANHATAVGFTALAYATRSAAFGYRAKTLAAASDSLALGSSVQADKLNQIVIGKELNGTKVPVDYDYSVKLGTHSSVALRNILHLHSKGKLELVGDEAQFVIPNYVLTGSPIAFPANANEGALIYDSTAKGLQVYGGSPAGWSAVSEPPAASYNWLTANNTTNFDATPTASGSDAIAIGDNATASGDDTIVMGRNASATTPYGHYGVAIGLSANAQTSSVAVGHTAKASGGGNSVAIGHSSKAYGDDSIAIGWGAYSISADQAICIGKNTSTNRGQSTNIGLELSSTSASTNVTHSVKVGYGATNANKNMLHLHSKGKLELYGDSAQFVLPNYAAGSPTGLPETADEGGLIYDATNSGLLVYAGSPAGWTAVGGGGLANPLTADLNTGGHSIISSDSTAGTAADNIAITAGQSIDGAYAAGNVSIYGGQGYSGTYGGSVTISGGSEYGAGYGGNVLIKGGDDASGGGSVTIRNGNNNAKLTFENGPRLTAVGRLDLESYSEKGISYGTTGAISLNTLLGTYFYPTGTTTGAITFSFTNPVTPPRVTTFVLEMLGAGNNAPVWPGSVTWANGVEPKWTTGTDIVSFFTRDQGTTWYGSAVVLNDATVDLNNADILNARSITFNSEVTITPAGSPATATADWTTGQKQKITITEATTVSFTAPSGQSNLTLKIINGGTGTITWPGTVKWASGTEPSWTTTGTDLASFYFDGTDYYGMAGLAFA